MQENFQLKQSVVRSFPLRRGKTVARSPHHVTVNIKQRGGHAAVIQLSSQPAGPGVALRCAAALAA